MDIAYEMQKRKITETSDLNVGQARWAAKNLASSFVAIVKVAADDDAMIRISRDAFLGTLTGRKRSTPTEALLIRIGGSPGRPIYMMSIG